jgi:hypothetical protein
MSPGVRDPLQVVVVGVVGELCAESDGLHGREGTREGAGTAADGEELTDPQERGGEEVDTTVFDDARHREAIEHRCQSDGDTESQRDGDDGAGEAEGVAPADATREQERGQTRPSMPMAMPMRERVKTKPIKRIKATAP